MRILEILSFGTLLLAFIGFFWPKSKRPRWMAFLPGLAVLWVLAHLVLEGFRWQMVPAYALTGLTFLATRAGISARGDNTRQDDVLAGAGRSP